MGTFLGYVEPTRPLIDWQLLQDLRWKRAREMMDKEGIDAVLTNVVDNVSYLTGWPRFRTSVYPGSYGTLFLREQKDPVIFCSEGDAGGVLKDRFYPDIRVMPPTQTLWPEPLGKALADYGLLKQKVGLDNRMQASLYNAVVKALPGVNFVNVTPLLNKIRAVKNAEEIKAYEHTVSLVESGINASIKAAAESWSRRPRGGARSDRRPGGIQWIPLGICPHGLDRRHTDAGTKAHLSYGVRVAGGGQGHYEAWDQDV